MENFDRVNGHLELDDILVSLYLDLPVCFVILRDSIHMNFSMTGQEKGGLLIHW
jgi:hypothetical protein